MNQTKLLPSLTRLDKSHMLAEKKKQPRPVHGWVIVDKPLGKTSTQIVGAVRRAFDVKKVGHAGTLDPLATGVVPIAIGEATKTVPYCQDYEKVYEFRIQWGEQRTTDDGEGDVIATSDKRPTRAEIEALIPEFKGTITQTPPQFSAIKVDGKRAYDLARAGEDVDLKPRDIEIFELDILDYQPDYVDVRVECGKGTYVRSIARDMGIRLGCYGYVSVLRRLAVGVFTLDDAISLDFLEKNGKTPVVDEALLPVETALDDIPALAVNESEASKLKNGGFIRLFSQHDLNRLKSAGLVFDKDNEQIAFAHTSVPIGLVRVIGAEIRPFKIFNL